MGSNSGSLAAPVLLLLVAADLLLAARSLPHTHPTAPEAVDGVRTAPAHLLTDPARAASPAAGGRFLGMSTITYDPGDMPDYQRIMLGSGPPQLDAGRFRRPGDRAEGAGTAGAQPVAAVAHPVDRWLRRRRPATAALQPVRPALAATGTVRARTGACANSCRKSHRPTCST